MNQKQVQTGHTTHRVPVLIVGGSLVGLSTSLFLGRLGVRHTLVERHAGTSIHPRGRGNNVRTMELFRTAGVEAGIRDAAATLAGNHGILQTPTLVGDAGEWLFREIDPGGGLARFSPSSWCLCSQNDLEPVLLEHAERLGGDLRYATELLSFESGPSGVTAVVKSRETGEHTTFLADYLVAADGPRSPVREQLGIGQSGPGDLFSNVSITFRSRRLAEVVGERRFIVCYLTDPAADGALLPVDNRENWVFHAPWHPERGETLEEFTDERCVEHIRRAVGVADLDVQITGRAPGTPPNGSPGATARDASSWPATRPTRCPPPGRSAPTPVSRTRTTSPGSSPRCTAAGPGSHCWTRTTPSAARSRRRPAPAPPHGRSSTAIPVSPRRPARAAAVARSAASSTWPSATAIRRAPSSAPTPRLRSSRNASTCPANPAAGPPHGGTAPG